MRCLIGLLKTIKRERMGEYANLLMDCLVSSPFESYSSTARLLCVKLIQRIGLVFLPPRLASWRY